MSIIHAIEQDFPLSDRDAELKALAASIMFAALEDIQFLTISETADIHELELEEGEAQKVAELIEDAFVSIEWAPEPETEVDALVA